MKNLLFLLVFSLMLVMSASAQYKSRPMFGTAANQDNTGRVLTYGYSTLEDTAGSTPDTLTIIPSNYNKYYMLTLTDSCVVAISNTSNSFIGSIITLIVENTAGSNHNVKLLGYSGLASQWIVSSTGTKLSVASSKRYVISFICDGTKWVEIYRMVEP